MSSTPLAGTTAVVTGASRGFGRAVASALLASGAQVVGIARDPGPLARAARELGGLFVPAVGDATDPDLAVAVLGAYRPRTVVLCAGAAPVMAALTEQSWETFSAVWEADVQQAFHWTQAALRGPLAPGSTMLSFSSGAALKGSPLSGGYAGAKAAVRFVADYAAQQSDRAGLGIRFATVLPNLTPATDLGRAAATAYAELAGVDLETFVDRMGDGWSPDQLASQVLRLLIDPCDGAYAPGPSGQLVAL